MTFDELLHTISADKHLDLSEAVRSGGCALRFDHSIDINFECQGSTVYLFSPLMSVSKSLPEGFFASLLQIHLFGVATERCWFGFDASEQRVILFCLLPMENLEPVNAIKRIETLIEQVRYWREILPSVTQKASFDVSSRDWTATLNVRRNHECLK